MKKERIKVFLCHGSEDKAVVRELYQRLREDSVDPWLDSENLVPGQDWELEIKKAVRSSDAILVCLSSSSVRKEGFLQKEIKTVLNIADEKPEGTIFIIPIKLDQCDLPERLSQWQYVQWWKENAYDLILKALRLRAQDTEVKYMPGDGEDNRSVTPSANYANSITYTSAEIRALKNKYNDGNISLEDIARQPNNEVITITTEALNETLSKYKDDRRRLENKEKLLALLGITPPYREWQEATTKNHCFTNSEAEEIAEIIFDRIPVNSSNLAFIAYDERSQTLEVTFLNRSVYHYYNIPHYHWDGLLHANSHGRYLDVYIKKGGYTYEQIK